MPCLNENEAAGILLYQGDSILLQRRTRDAPIYPSMWNIFGGMIEEGETPENAALREIAEEIGVKVAPPDLRSLGVVRVLRGDDTALVYYFSSPLKVERSEIYLGEGDGFSLFGHEDIQLLQMPPEMRLAIDRHYEQKEFGWVATAESLDQ